MLFYVQFDDIAEPTLLNNGFRNADSPGIADAHQFDSHKFFASDYIVIALALRVQTCFQTLTGHSLSTNLRWALLP
jgi:hypothetical protein